MKLGTEIICVTKCGHIYCYECINVTIQNTNNCPMCRTRITKNDLYTISFLPIPKMRSTIINNKLELINNVGTKLANLIYYLKTIKNHVIIFSQWNNLLTKVGVVLNKHGINSVFCKGNVWQRNKIINTFNDDDSLRVLLLSSENAASGTNLCKASKVIFIDAFDGTPEYIQQSEWQAIGRIYRLGQTQDVEIVRFIIKDTIEEELYIKHIKDNKLYPLKINETFDSQIELSATDIKDINNKLKIVK